MFASVANRRMYKSINLREKWRVKMAMTYTATGGGDMITGIQEISEFELSVTFAESGTYTVSKIMNREAYEKLLKMKAGDSVTVATLRNQVMWVKAS